jgi:TolB-like protein
MAGDGNPLSETENAAVRVQLRSILTSAMFVQADRLSRFLTYVVEESAAGRSQLLNQYAIAVQVFDRDANFDPGVDAIVRVEAARLRSKLLEYYDDLGRKDAIRIELPKYSYSAKFRYSTNVDLSPKTNDTSSVPSGLSDVEAVKSVEPRPQKPTLAVMPFLNLSDDSEQDYFADGIAEDLITDFSKQPGLFVISRHSSFTYKRTALSVSQICEELDADLILQGSVRKLGDKVRISAQLIDGVNDQHLWAQRYDRDLEDLFDIQDEVNRMIITACQLRLTENEREIFERHETKIVEAYDYLLRGRKETQANTRDGSARARYCFEKAIELDPKYAAAYARLSLSYTFHWIQGWNSSAKDSLFKGRELALRAVAIEGRLSVAHAALSWSHLWHGDHDMAIAEGRLANDLDPDDVLALERLAMCLIFSGDVKSSLPLIDKARKLNPHFTYDFVYGLAMFMKSDYERCIEYAQRCFDASPNFVPAGLYLASSHSLTGNIKEATQTIERIRLNSPSYELFKGFLAQFKHRDDRERFIRGLKIAGLEQNIS